MVRSLTWDVEDIFSNPCSAWLELGSPIIMVSALSTRLLVFLVQIYTYYTVFLI